MTPTITIGNSYCTLSGFSPDILSAIQELLSYESQTVQYEIRRCETMIRQAEYSGNHRKAWGFNKKIENLKQELIVCWLRDEQFPTGHLQLVEEALGALGCKYRCVDNRVKPARSLELEWKVEPPEMRYYQKEMVDLALEKHRGVFESAVGTGKSLVIFNIIKRLFCPTLVIVPSSGLYEQIGAGLEESFGEDLVERLTTTKVAKGKALAPLRIATIQTLAALQKRGILEGALADIDMMIVDEIHHAGSLSFTNLIPHLEHIYYKFGFSGTFVRNAGDTLDMWGFLSQKLYSYPAKQAIEEGFLTPLKFIIEKLPGRRHKDYATEYNLNYGGSERLLQAIGNRLRYIPGNEQVLILVDRKEKAGDVIHEFLTAEGYPNTYISGDNKKAVILDAITAFNEKRIRILVGSSVLGEGIDLRTTNRLMLCCGGRSEVKISQAIGRAVRLSEGKKVAWVYDYWFQGTNYLEKHTKRRIALFREQFAGDIQIVG
jgi:superfamily II DNA or RNA helicase